MGIIRTRQFTEADWMLKLTGSTNNRYYGSLTSTGPATFTLILSTLRSIPFIVPKSISIDNIQLEVTTAGGVGATARMGVYTDDGAGYPSTLLTETDVAAVATDTTGVKTNAISPTVAMSPGLYWLALQSDANVTQPIIRAFSTSNMPMVFGYLSTMGANGNGSMYTVARTIAALPAAYPAGSTIVANTNPFMVLVRLA